jgi:hypothetical protein
MTLHDPLLGDIFSTAPATEADVAEEDVPEAPAGDDLWDSFTAGCARTWADVRAWWRHPRDALAAFYHWEPPSAAEHDIYVQSVTGDRFEELHQRVIGRGGVRLGVAWIGLVSRGRVFWPVVLAAAALGVVADLLITR